MLNQLKNNKNKIKIPVKIIKALVFDLGNVLIFFDWKIAQNRLNELQPELGDKTTKFLKENRELIHSLECGKISDDFFLNKVRSAVNSNLDKNLLAKIYSEIFWENNELTSLLPQLKKQYKLYLLSNTNSIHRKYGWNNYSFLKNFDRLFLSYEIGYVKPEKEIYEFVIKNINIKPDELVYIDDIKEYVDAAIKSGWNAIQYLNFENLLIEFKNYKIAI